MPQGSKQTMIMHILNMTQTLGLILTSKLLRGRLLDQSSAEESLNLIKFVAHLLWEWGLVLHTHIQVSCPPSTCQSNWLLPPFQPWVSEVTLTVYILSVVYHSITYPYCQNIRVVPACKVSCLPSTCQSNCGSTCTVHRLLLFFVPPLPTLSKVTLTVYTCCPWIVTLSPTPLVRVFT